MKIDNNIIFNYYNKIERRYNLIRHKLNKINKKYYNDFLKFILSYKNKNIDDNFYEIIYDYYNEYKEDNECTLNIFCKMIYNDKYKCILDILQKLINKFFSLDDNKKKIVETYMELSIVIKFICNISKVDLKKDHIMITVLNYFF